MKKYAKKIVAIALAVMLVSTCFAGCAKINYVTNGTIAAIKQVQDGSWKDQGKTEGEDAGAADAIEEFTPGTYGGIDFKSVDDVVAYYVEAFNKTKAHTIPYGVEGGGTEDLYALVGTEVLTVKSILVDGKENGVINNAVAPIVSNLFKGGVKGLPPTWSCNPNSDNDGETDFRTSQLLAEDVQACNVKDNGDGTITMQIQPKPVNIAMHNADAQGRFFAVLGDIKATVDSIGIVTFAQGGIDDNIKAMYEGGFGTVTIDTASGEVVSGNYLMKVEVAITHANALGILKDKSATVSIEYVNEFPASDEYLADHGYTRM